MPYSVRVYKLCSSYFRVPWMIRLGNFSAPERDTDEVKKVARWFEHILSKLLRFITTRISYSGRFQELLNGIASCRSGLLAAISFPVLRLIRFILLYSLVRGPKVFINKLNKIEMWHKDTYDPVTIERELAMAEKLGFNTLRVYLHDLVWSNDRIGFEKRIDHFLGLASSHNMYVILVLFDDCHRPDPYYGAQQPAPIARVHNSGWKHSPVLYHSFKC